MTAQTPAYLKTRFENGDIPQATDYEDVFDSFVNFTTSAEQNLQGNLRTNGQFVGDVSASRINVSAITATTFTADSFITSALRGTTVSAGTLYADVAKLTSVSANSMNVATVTAGTHYIVSADSLRAVNVSAVSTTQAGALLVDAPLTFVTFADNTDNSVRLGASVRGVRQTIVNATTTAIKIFPAVSARFLVTAFNASLTIQADKTVTVYHQGDDRYGVQVG